MYCRLSVRRRNRFSNAFETSGKENSYARAHRKVENLLQSYTTPGLEKGIEKDMNSYAEAHYPPPGKVA